MSSPCMAQASIVSGQTINSRSAGVAAEGGEESALSGLRSMVTTRVDDMILSTDVPRQLIDFYSGR